MHKIPVPDLAELRFVIHERVVLIIELIQVDVAGMIDCIIRIEIFFVSFVLNNGDIIVKVGCPDGIVFIPLAITSIKIDGVDG